MDDNEIKAMEETVIDIGKGIAKAGAEAFKRGVIAGVGATIIGICVGHLMIFLPKAIKRRKEKTDKQ